MRLSRTALCSCLLLLLFAGSLFGPAHAQERGFELREAGFFESRGLDVLVFNNWYSGYFSDSKLSGIELIHHDERTVTNGDVRLSNTPEQWDPIPQFQNREIDQENERVVASLAYPEHNFEYQISVEPQGHGVRVRVHLDDPVPEALEGRAGFNLEFLPSAYFGKTYLMDGEGGLLPRAPGGPMHTGPTGEAQADPLARGSTLVMAPNTPKRRVRIDGRGATLSLYDGRNKAQNGWYVVRSLLPADETGTVLEWQVTPHRVPDWMREPVIAHSQVGYHPDQKKTAVIEMGPHYSGSTTARLLRIEPDGSRTVQRSAEATPWGDYLRYEYAHFDFSSVHTPGLYVLQFGEVTTAPFRIAEDVYGKAIWSTTLDTFMPVQMDHMFVNDRYRVWHGTSHLDDARQAPTDHEHFDLYAQGPTTDTPFAPGEHIPGLNIGGWYDAGDYDIRMQSQYATVRDLVLAYETFDLTWDETTVEPHNRYVDLRQPDGTPDILQQIEHGTRGLLAQYQAVGHAIPGIIVPTIAQYTHLGDGVTMTDNLVHDPSLDSLETEGNRSGRPDDRWAFTNKSTPLDYGSAAALAAASRALAGYNDTLATQSRQTAVRVWNKEQQRDEPIIFRSGNTTGGPLEYEELKATVELLLATRGEPQYANHLREMWPYVEEHFGRVAGLAVRALPHMNEEYRADVERAVRAYAARLDTMQSANPFGVPVTTGGWGGAGAVLGFAKQNYILHRAFPNVVGREHTLRGLAYILGTHPASSVSLVSGVGAHSQTVAYGVNRADFSFIPGGVVPGVTILDPNFPELKEDWPYLWFENEYVITPAASYIYVGNAARALMEE